MKTKILSLVTVTRQKLGLSMALADTTPESCTQNKRVPAPSWLCPFINGVAKKPLKMTETTKHH